MAAKKSEPPSKGGYVREANDALQVLSARWSEFATICFTNAMENLRCREIADAKVWMSHSEAATWRATGDEETLTWKTKPLNGEIN